VPPNYRKTRLQKVNRASHRKEMKFSVMGIIRMVIIDRVVTALP
jgi:hypothetical protein